MNNPFHPYYNFYRPKYINRRNYPTNIHDNLNLEKNTSKDVSEESIIETADETRKSDSTLLNLDKPLLEFRGFKLYYDDMLILALIYFLYLENINDTLLYIALFALLFF